MNFFFKIIFFIKSHEIRAWKSQASGSTKWRLSGVRGSSCSHPHIQLIHHPWIEAKRTLRMYHGVSLEKNLKVIIFRIQTLDTFSYFFL